MAGLHQHPRHDSRRMVSTLIDVEDDSRSRLGRLAQGQTAVASSIENINITIRVNILNHDIYFIRLESTFDWTSMRNGACMEGHKEAGHMETPHALDTPLAQLNTTEIINVWVRLIGEPPPITADKSTLAAVLNECVDADLGGKT